MTSGLIPGQNYVTSLAEVFWGGPRVAVTLAKSALGLLSILRGNLRLKNHLEPRGDSWPLPWRLLAGLLVTAGLLNFAWSTGVLLTQAQEFPEQ